jgi:hypothetical protein
LMIFTGLFLFFNTLFTLVISCSFELIIMLIHSCI